MNSESRAARSFHKLATTPYESATAFGYATTTRREFIGSLAGRSGLARESILLLSRVVNFARRRNGQSPLNPFMSHVHFADDPPPWEPQFEQLCSPPPRRRRPLDPPPPCFSTPSPLRVRCRDFPPFSIPAVSDRLADGFRLLYPCDVLERHGITRVDWIRFLQDLAVAARLPGEGLSAIRSRMPTAPLRAHHIFPSRAFSTVYDSRFAQSAAEDVRALIQIWNECAFERRKIRVALVQPWVRQQTGASEKMKSWSLVVEAL